MSASKKKGNVDEYDVLTQEGSSCVSHVFAYTKRHLRIAVKSISFCAYIMLIMFCLRSFLVSGSLNAKGCTVGVEFIFKIVLLVLSGFESISTTSSDNTQSIYKSLNFMFSLAIAFGTFSLPFADWMTRNTGVQESLTFPWLDLALDGIKDGDGAMSKAEKFIMHADAIAFFVTSLALAIALHRQDGILGKSPFYSESSLGRTPSRINIVQMVVLLVLFIVAIAKSKMYIYGKFMSDCNNPYEFTNAFYMVACGYMASKNSGGDQSLRNVLEQHYSNAKDESAKDIFPFIGSSEKYVYDRDSGIKHPLYRRTVGFDGPKDIDINLKYPNPPNVLVISLESFTATQMGWLYPFKKYADYNSPTPNLDELSKSGLVFSNAWCNGLFTTRSLEAAMYGNIGKKDATVKTCSFCKMKGLPDLMRSKGYNVKLSSCGNTRDMSYENWRPFFKSEGYTDEDIWDIPYHEGIARENNISMPDKASIYLQWGLHDSYTFKTLGAKIKQMHKDRKNRKNEKPFYIHHFAISSHLPFTSRPSWYVPPKFSKGQIDKNDKIQMYLEMVYFTDHHLGLMMKDLRESKVLDNTVVIIMGDHGPPLRYKKKNIRDRSWQSIAPLNTQVPMIFIADKQLGKYEGVHFNKSVSHFDIINTLADMLGVPEGGFVQQSLGRSVIRKELPEREVSYFNFQDHCVVQFRKYRIACSCSDVLGTCHVFDTFNDPNMYSELNANDIKSDSLLSAVLQKLTVNARITPSLEDDLNKWLIAERDHLIARDTLGNITFLHDLSIKDKAIQTDVYFLNKIEVFIGILAAVILLGLSAFFRHLRKRSL